MKDQEKGREVRLRDVVMRDAEIFFEQQRDPEANWMAAFTVKDPEDKEVFMTRWTKHLADEKIKMQTIVWQEKVVGSVLSYVDEEGQTEVSYWLGRAYWGKGIATSALMGFLEQRQERPLYARAAKDNKGSLRVLEKVGFIRVGEDKGFANARGEEIEEYILRLE